MNKPAKPEADDVDLFGPPLTQAEEDAWFDRNREAIGQLVDEALAETEPPTPWNFEEMLADAKAAFAKNQKG